ncbi:hypothetical protein FACS1894172_19860 [Spirochaetia bacterium]|nr:hypothetical protein FACS1894164_07030 [Spirochaetia bacterium]GHU36781.1 hypothetical protein FACS1894172_19860 [Spirochaetia bacterium]
MAVQPIDLQTLFTQVEKIGKEQGALREGAALHQAWQGAESQRKLDEHIRAVNESQNIGEGVEPVKDRRGGRNSGKEHKRHNSEQDSTDSGYSNAPIFKDPALGKNLDFSG